RHPQTRRRPAARRRSASRSARAVFERRSAPRSALPARRRPPVRQPSWIIPARTRGVCVQPLLPSDLALLPSNLPPCLPAFPPFSLPALPLAFPFRLPAFQPSSLASSRLIITYRFNPPTSQKKGATYSHSCPSPASAATAA